jgi:hypothetical protein
MKYAAAETIVKLVRAAVLLVLITSLTFSAFGQNKGVQNAHADANDMRGLIISGQGFVFLASEPQGWDTDTGKAATEYSVNAIFFPRVQVSRSHHVTIRVRLNQKTTEDPNEDMRGDVNDYKKRYPSTKFADLDFKHPNYKTCAKLFYTQGDFYEYVAYLNPGPQYKFMFSVALSKEKQAATQDELAAFSHVLRSLQFVSEDVQEMRPR